MGVPKFCRYICERYPCLLELLNEYQIPEFDNLYLDMNGIIHTCSHPNDMDAHFRITEENIFKNIFQYIEILFNTIKPQKLFFMAVDGVAPRAKINQQRGRRFRAAKEAEAVEARARAKGEEIPKEARFDSNCITPGTLFMARLTEQLKYFVTWKISTSKLWQKCKVILSGPEVPGEGEHKIMDYIRYMKSQPDYDPNTRHCLYGLDADLIMLSLCTHEPHFAVLREEVKYGKVKKSTSPEKTRFCLLHITLLREYMEHEFAPVKDKLEFPFDIEKIIDDWILMGFLVGNDFIPNLPNLHIETGALTILYKAYMEVLPSLDGYINEAGTLNLERFEKFMERLSQVDTDQFMEHLADLKYFEAHTGRRPNENERTSYRKPKDSPENLASPKKSANRELSALIQSTNDMLIGHSDEEDSSALDSDSETYNEEFSQHKRDYYMNKLEYENVDAEVLRSQAVAYVTAIQWNLNYYYNGCCSWSWFYPHHYAPYISDIKGFQDFKIEFELAKPFLPFQQLLAVLPAASRKLLPEAYQGLLTEEQSPIIDYYPLDFKTDLNHKKQEWEAVVLIPFIDEKSLLDAMEPYNAKLTPEEQKRNKHGPMSIITYTDEDLGLYEAPQYFPTIHSHAKVVTLNREAIDVPVDKLVKGLCKGVKLSTYFAGFPTFQHIKHTAAFEMAKVKVFEQPSRRENMIISVVPSEIPNLHDAAGKILGKTVFVGWPQMKEALVVGVSTNDRKITLINTQRGYSPENVRIEDLNAGLSAQWSAQCRSVYDGYKGRFGIDVGDIGVLVYALPMCGRQYILTAQGRMSLEKTWSTHPTPYAHQAIVTDIAVHDPGYVHNLNITDVFTVKSIVFMLGHPHYGAMGEVIEPGLNAKTGRIKVAMRIENEPNFESIQRQFGDSEAQWMSTGIAAQRLGVSNHFLSRITGSIYVTQGSAEAPENGKQNVGLNLKFTKRNEELPGYTKKSSGQWLYSTKSIGLIRSYMHQYPLLFERLAKRVTNDIYMENDLFESGPEKLSEVVEWLKEQPFACVDTRSCNSIGLDGDTIAKLQKELESMKNSENQDAGKTVLMQVKPHLLYKPGLHSGNLPPDPKAHHKLFDRIISVKDSSTVPLGYKGTIVCIQKAEDASDTVYDILFDKEFVGGVSFSGGAVNRRHKLHEADFINISHGARGELDIASITSGIPKQTPVPPKSWRQDSTNSKKQTLQNFPNSSARNPRQIPFPNFNQNKKVSNTEPQQIRVMKKNDATVNRPTQANCEAQKGTKQPQNSGKVQAPTSTIDSGDIKNTIFPQKQPAQPPRPDQTSEFQMLWNELYKSSLPPSGVLTQKPIMPSVMSQPKPVSMPPSANDSLQDESAFLKAMLKISDENSSSSSKSSVSIASKPVVAQESSNTSRAPPLVQQLFDHARQASRKEPLSYTAKLLEYSQLSGRGMPRFNYHTNQQNMICAQIVMPDMRTYCGEFFRASSEAAENAAEIVCKDLHLDKASKPGLSILGAPPPMWLNPLQNDLSQTPHNARPPPMMPPRSPQVFPNMHNPPMHMQQWNPRMPRAPAFPQVPHPNINQNRPPPAQNSTQAMPNPAEIARNVNKPESKNKKNTPFVPLQAQKKSTNPKPKQTSRNSNQTAKETKHQSHETQPRKIQDDASKQSKEDKSDNERKDTDTKKSPQTPQKVQRAPKPRRSRIAANFNTAPAPNGNAPQ
ncbi:5'-3' exoribonuclease 1 [Venturia canescens]|uniref:5'-3' exoribonuclease 1 n=1 Tax=Venturia canescens TaxID=32260 RepID=UPI001C9CF3C1|nr:5'-3' exoribonuclease 1 [Venturia canescens]